MDVKLITNGDLKKTKLINLRTGEEVKNIRIVDIENPDYEPFHSEEMGYKPSTTYSYDLTWDGEEKPTA